MGPTGIRYDLPGPLTSLEPAQKPFLAQIPDDPVELCRLVQGLVIQPVAAAGLELPAERQSERAIRRCSDLVSALMALDPAPLRAGRPPQKRVIGTSRHFAVLSCALLRFREIPARARCGFATYFAPGKSVDHWIAEYWRGDQSRWVRVDTELLGLPVAAHPEDLVEGSFLSGGEAWALYRRGAIDPARFGVDGDDPDWGLAEIRANAVRDLAALNKVEMLPWDSWGLMEAAYRGETDADYDQLMDRLASACVAADTTAVSALFAMGELSVPAIVIG